MDKFLAKTAVENVTVVDAGGADAEYDVDAKDDANADDDADAEDNADAEDHADVSGTNYLVSQMSQ